MKDYGKPIFIGKELNPNEQIIQNKILHTRREMIKTGTKPKNLEFEILYSRWKTGVDGQISK